MLRLASMQCSVDSAVARLDSLWRYRASAPFRAAMVQACKGAVWGSGLLGGGRAAPTAAAPATAIAWTRGAASLPRSHEHDAGNERG